MSEDNDRLSNESPEPPDAFLDKTLKQEPHLSPEAETPETVCRNCIFAVYEENTQTSCELGRIQSSKIRALLLMTAMMTKEMSSLSFVTDIVFFGETRTGPTYIKTQSSQ